MMWICIEIASNNTNESKIAIVHCEHEPYSSSRGVARGLREGGAKNLQIGRKKNAYILEMILESSTTHKMNTRRIGSPHTGETNELAGNLPFPIPITRVGRWICQADFLLFGSVRGNVYAFVKKPNANTNP